MTVALARRWRAVRSDRGLRKAVENELTKLAVDGRADFRVFKKKRAGRLHFGVKAFAEAGNLCLVA